MHFVSLIFAVSVGTASVVAPPAWAGNDKDKDHKAKKERKEKDDLKPGAYFDEQARNGVREYYAKGKHCPPGLAKKNNGCMPPGQAKKWRIGEPMPRDVAQAPVPRDVLVLLPRLPPGHQYISQGGDILLIAASSRMVVDAITITVTIR